MAHKTVLKVLVFFKLFN